MTDKLKPCPFCGGEKLKIDYKSRKGLETYSVRCNKCHARGGTASLHVHSMVDTKGYAELKSSREIVKKQAIKAWNTRKDMDRIVDELAQDEKRWRESGIEFNDATELGIAQGLRLAIKTLKGGAE